MANKKPFTKKIIVKAVQTVLAVSIYQGAYAGEKDMLDVDIPNQKVGSALMALGQNAGVQIVLGKGARNYNHVSSIKGQYTLDQALGLLLEDSGLKYEFVSENTVFVEAEDNSDSEEQDSEASLEADEEVVITGSRLRHVEPYSPVQVITREDIQRRGFTTTEDLFRSLSANQSDLNSASSLDGTRLPTNFQGNVTINLRGLGQESTLVLVNGRRVASGAGLGSNNGFNVGGIPISTIERIEISTDGGSSIYGSDAVGGTVSIFTRKDFVGSETTVSYEDSFSDANTESFSQYLGVGWGSGNASFNYSKVKRDPARANRVGFTTEDIGTLIGLPPNPNVGTAPVRILPFAPPFQFGALPEGTDPTNFTLADIRPENIQAIDRVRPFLSSTVETDSYTLDVNQEFGDSFEANLNVRYSETESVGPLDSQGYFQVLPPSSPINPTGATLVVFGDLFELVDSLQLKPQTIVGEPSSLNISGGFLWDVPYKDWDFRFDATVSSSESTLFRGNALLVPELLEAANNGTINLFDPLSNSVEALSALIADQTSQTPKNTARSFIANLDGQLASLPAGDLRFSLGTEFRPEIASGFSEQFPEPPTRDVLAVFTELNFPLVSGKNALPGVNSLSVRLAARWEEYDLQGQREDVFLDRLLDLSEKFTNTSPTLSVSWGITDTLNVRLNWGESFVAPTPTALFSDVTLTTAQQPVLDPRALGGERQVVVDFFSGGSETLQPETSDTTSVVIDWTPKFLEGFSASVAYNEIDFSNRIAFLQVNSPQAVRELLNSPELEADFAPRDEAGNLLAIISRPFNQSFAFSKNVDVNLSYAFDNDWGSFQATLNASYIKDNVAIDQVGEDITDFVASSDFFSDRVRGNAVLYWDRDNYGATVTYNHTSSHRADFEGPFSILDRIEGESSWDISAHYILPESGWRFQLGIDNALNERAPFSPIVGPFDPRRFDTRGRVISGSVVKSLSW
ncbi:TonB-dependent receptor [Porticoccus sp. W117]|uniref:TonB-dependent receptor n=1 Tax=Porticoccus sp. W117 TaxID=3054777 RepID=UPI00259A9DB2|nr:TonB-dependent receptor [Porticoccus sp. W117]MDM3869770.1 TonB-dependent receptor [Porticoccus sp. W117]